MTNCLMGLHQEYQSCFLALSKCERNTDVCVFIYLYVSASILD